MTRKKGVYFGYSEKQMEDAIHAVTQGGMSKGAA